MDYEAIFLRALADTGQVLGVGDDAVLLQKASRLPPYDIARISTTHIASRIHIARTSRVDTSHNAARINASSYAMPSCFIAPSTLARIYHSHKDLVIATDGFCEHVHFKRSWMQLTDITKKAMLVNISDMLAMNATPKYALISLTLPILSASDIAKIARALGDIARQYNITIIGGDTTKGEHLAFHITILGIPHGKIISRKGLKRGDMVYCTGRVGSSGKALAWLLKGGKITDSKRFARFRAPFLRQEFIHFIASFVTAGLDVSDGVLAELHRLEELHHLRFMLVDSTRIEAYRSGEEYELLFAIDPRNRHRLFRIAKRTRTPLEYIARVGRRGKIPRAKIWHT